MENFYKQTVDNYAEIINSNKLDMIQIIQSFVETITKSEDISLISTIKLNNKKVYEAAFAKYVVGRKLAVL